MKKFQKNIDDLAYERMEKGMQWTIALPAWLCPSAHESKNGMECLNSHILSSDFPYPYPCSIETCPMIISKKGLKLSKFYKDNGKLPRRKAVK